MTKGLTWAMCMPYDSRSIIFVLIGSVVYDRSLDCGWYGNTYPSNEAADSSALKIVRNLEMDGAILVAGPVEFEAVGHDKEYMDIATTGWLAERALRIKGVGVVP